MVFHCKCASINGLSVCVLFVLLCEERGVKKQCHSIGPGATAAWTECCSRPAHSRRKKPQAGFCGHRVATFSIRSIYTVFKVDGSALFQSARIDGADFLNFDTRKGRDIHPRYFCGPRHLCQKMFQGCAIYARILKSKVSKPPFPFSSPFALNFPFLLPPFPFSFPSPLSFLLSLSPPFPPPFHLPLQMERFGNL